ncbi:MAG: carbohydrate-binding family 9-like protein [Acidobacteriia bacterium]|nr:carbohydrate-binding family 9-like protein [Terriglobia bacterium]
MKHIALLLPVTLMAADPAPKNYTCYRAATPPAIDGKLGDPLWRRTPWTDYFVDIEGNRKPAPRFRTRVKMAWDDRFFYVAAQMEEPHVWGTLTAHDAVIFRDNDFEVFLRPDATKHLYFEFEMNALNTGWDLFLPKPYNQGGKADNSWEIPGLQTGVHIEGTLNHPADRDRGWSVEIAFPWEAFRERAGGDVRPAPGASWRVNFSRVEWRVEVVDGRYRKLPGLKEDNWVWSPQHVINMHVPEQWGFVRFSPQSR